MQSWKHKAGAGKGEETKSKEQIVEDRNKH